MSQPSIFDGAVRSCDPATAKRAALGITDRTAQTILATYVGGYGLTDDELCARLPDLHAPTVKSARSRLTGAGLLVDTGQRRLSNRGRHMTVWFVVGQIDVDVRSGRL